MAIVRPVTKTLISVPNWGVPITDEVNALRTELDALKPTAWTALPLSNGWTALDAQRTPRYRKIGDNVYIQGCITGGIIAYGTTAFTLPAGFRPRSDTSFLTPMAGTVAAFGNIIITAAGLGYVSAATGSTVNNGFCYLDLPPFAFLY